MRALGPALVRDLDRRGRGLGHDVLGKRPLPQTLVPFRPPWPQFWPPGRGIPCLVATMLPHTASFPRWRPARPRVRRDDKFHNRRVTPSASAAALCAGTPPPAVHVLRERASRGRVRSSGLPSPPLPPVPAASSGATSPAAVCADTITVLRTTSMGRR